MLGGTAGTPPYRLSIVELAPRDLKVVRTIPVGRGYGLTLLDGPGGSLLVSTGRQLLEVDASGTVHTVASFPGAVVQHVAVVPGSGLVLASLFTPSAMAPAASTRLALVDLRSGLLVSDLSLPVGEEVESLVAGPGGALVAVSDGDSTEVEPRLGRCPLAELGPSPSRRAGDTRAGRSARVRTERLRRRARHLGVHERLERSHEGLDGPGRAGGGTERHRPYRRRRLRGDPGGTRPRSPPGRLRGRLRPVRKRSEIVGPRIR